MFENVIAQDFAVSLLSSEFEREELPGSLLFEGPSRSAKLTTALEMARAISCTGTAAWNCPCESCGRHRILSHPDLLLLGPKSFREEIGAGLDLLERVPGASSRYFFVRSARKLLKRFEPELFAGEEGRLSKALPLARSIAEGLDACVPGRGSDGDATKEAAKLLAYCFKLEALVPDSTPVFQVRALESWARLSPNGKRKVIVVEHADRMLDASRNALLKILEEPPATVAFVLTTSRRSAMIPTILSRLRKYRFKGRDAKSSAAVLERVFRARGSEGRGDLDAYMESFRKEGNAGFESDARAFLSAALADYRATGPGASGGAAVRLDPPLEALADGADRSTGEVIAAVAARTKNFGSGDDAFSYSFPAFLESIESALGSILREAGAGNATVRFAETAGALVRDASMRYTSYNLNPVSLSELLAQGLSEAP